LLAYPENNFLTTPEELPAWQYKKPKNKKNERGNLASLLKNFKKNAKLARIEEALEIENTDYIGLAKAFKISRQQIRVMHLSLKGKRNYNSSTGEKTQKPQRRTFELSQRDYGRPKKLLSSFSSNPRITLQKFNLPINYCCIYTIHKALKFLKITHKRVVKMTENRNTERTKCLRKLTARFLLQSIKKNHKVIFLDEVGFN